MRQMTLTQSGVHARIIDWTNFFLTPALNKWISSKFLTFHWIRLLFILLILVGAELPLCIVVTLS